MDKSIKGGTALTAELFDYTRINARAAYVQLYGKLPNCVQMYRINTEKAYKFIQSEYKDLIVQDIHNAEIYADKPKLEKTETLLIMKNEVLIELGETYCEVYYSGEECSLVEKLKEQLPKYKRTKRRPLEINLITQSRRG
ncbi:MAG: hypothetical protein H6551_10680, partial [Chitinophagales bacterium]|nr:hypothetical protein [Chitinophagales bacterium]